MEITKENNNKEKESSNTLLVPFIYIKRAIIRIWKFLPNGLSFCFNCNLLYLIIIFL